MNLFQVSLCVYPGDFGGNAHGVTFDAKFWWPFQYSKIT